MCLTAAGSTVTAAVKDCGGGYKCADTKFQNLYHLGERCDFDRVDNMSEKLFKREYLGKKPAIFRGSNAQFKLKYSDWTKQELTKVRGIASSRNCVHLLHVVLRMPPLQK
jgi:hypothetical protein